VCGGQLGVLVVRVAMAEGNVWMWEVDVVMGFGFWDLGCCCASIDLFGRVVLVAVAYREGVRPAHDCGFVYCQSLKD
jgi:hypothetical protein